MTEHPIPDWWHFLVLALAVLRLTRLIGWDTITRPARDKLVRRNGDRMLPGYRPKLDEFFHCPYCLGLWISLITWASYWAWPAWTLWVALPFAISAVVGLVANHLDE